jgi:rod shape determining protein RodA
LKFDRRLLFHFDWTLLGMVLGLCLIGLVNIYSTVFSAAETGADPLYLKQAKWILLGLISMTVAFSVDYRFVHRYAYWIYGISVLALVAVLVLGYESRGSQRWLSLWGFRLQPSEFMKLAVIVALTKYFDDHRVSAPFGLRDLRMPFVLILVPFLLILKQPDLGTALIIALLFASMAVCVGVRWSAFLSAFASGLLLIPVMWYFLKDYQRERIMTFFSPERDPLGSGYHIIQSIIAVGSGGFLGKGFLKGSQTQLKFLPEQQTDFVFSVFAEEWGFLGGLVLIVLFLSLILWGLKIALHSRDFPGMMITYGIILLIFWEVFINIGMVLGVLPVVGIPLPFLSYGGSSIVMLMTGVGLMMNVSMRRFALQP